MKNKHPAEVQRGLIWQETFENATSIAKNGGTITGALEFRDKGAYFDGTNDSILYSIRGPMFATGYWSAVIEFIPNFTLGDGVGYCLFSSDSGKTYCYLDSSHVLRVIAGNGTGAIAVNLVDYQAYWKAGQRNVLVMSMRSGANTLWLNGTQLTSNANAWTAQAQTSLYLGARNDLAYKFKGTICSFKFFVFYAATNLLTAQEALDYYTGQTFNYNKRATCILPMTADSHDATNLRTSDASGNGNHFTFGDGSTPTTYPTKLAKRGYSFDGGDYLTGPTGGLISSLSKFTVVFYGKRNSTSLGVACGESRTSPVIAYRQCCGITTAGNIFHAACNSLSSSSMNNTTDYLNILNACLIQIYDGSQSTDATKLKAYLNGNLLSLTNGGGAIPSSLSGINGNVYIGRISTTANGTWQYTTGEIYYFALYPFTLTPLQVIDATLKLQKQLNLT